MARFQIAEVTLFASNIQIVYKCETVQTSHSAMLNYNTTKDTDNNMNNFEEEEDDDDNKRKIIEDDHSETTSLPSKQTKSKSKSKPKSTSSNNTDNNYSRPIKLSTFQHLKPLSKRIIIWCYPFDPNNPQEFNMVNFIQSFPRPEVIPISSLYCEDVS